MCRHRVNAVLSPYACDWYQTEVHDPLMFLLFFSSIEKCNRLYLDCPVPLAERLLIRGGGALIYFSVRGRAAEQGIIFRIPTPGQGIIFVKIGSTTGSIWGRYGHY